AVSRANMLGVLRSVATSNGLRVTLEGSLIRVDAVESATVAQGAQRTREAPQLYVYRLKHARAPRLAGTLQALYGARAGDIPATAGLSDRQLTEQLRMTRVPVLNIDTIGRGAQSASSQVSATGSIIGDVQIVPDETT